MISETNILDIKNFKRLKKIGESRFSTIFTVREIKTGKIYAAKIFTNEMNKNTQELIGLAQQVSILSKIKHKSINKFYGVSLLDFHKENHPVLFSEYIKNGSLDRMLRFEKEGKSPPEWTFTKKLINIYGIASALQYLHSHEILHRDLKPRNVLLDNHLYPKICDFWFTKMYQDVVIENFMEGRSFFYSPEMINGTGESTNKSDVFAFAMTVYNIITGDQPSLKKRDTFFTYYAKLIEGERPKFEKEIPESYKKLITDCWSQDPSERITFDEIINRLKTDKGFITPEVNEDEYLKYIRSIETYEDRKQQQQQQKEEEDEGVDLERSFSYSDYDDDRNEEEEEEEEEEEVKKKPFVIDVKNLDLKNFEKEDKIGQGYSSDVYKVRSKTTSSIYAAKVLKNEIFEDNKDSKIAENLLREVQILAELSHPTIMKFYGYSGTDFINICRPVIVTEYLGNGSIEDIIELERSGFKVGFWDDTMKLITIYGIAKSLSYLHSKDIIHRDLKPVNVLADEYLFPKLADFGFSKHLNSDNKIIDKNAHQILSGIMGTSAFIAPEIWKDAIYSKSGDVYAFGMLVYELITLEIPFYGVNNNQISYAVVNKKQRPKIKKTIPKHYKELIEECWSQDYSKRPTIENVLKKLETDQRFIENLNEQFYHNYIKFIKEQEQNNSGQKNKYSFQKYSLEEMHKEIKENKSILIGEGFIDIESYFNKSEIYRNDFSIFCDVSNKMTGQIYSAEISNINISNLNNKEKKALTDEVEILTKLKHPTIQRIIGYSLYDFEHQTNPVIIREHTSNETLFNLLSKERNGIKNANWTDTKKLICIYGIARGMLYLHSNNVIHHELNTHTIFVEEDLTPKISEFGFMIKPQNSSRISNHSMIKNINNNNNGNNNGIKIPYYLAPEVLQCYDNELDNKNQKASDVYSFAFVVYEVLTNKIPFENIKDQNQFFNEVINKVSRPSLDQVPSKYGEMISSCWSSNPDDRPSFEMIVDILKTDKDIITDKINTEEYHNYINSFEQNNI